MSTCSGAGDVALSRRQSRHCVGGVGSGRASVGWVERAARLLPRRLRRTAALELPHHYSGPVAARSTHSKAHL